MKINAFIVFMFVPLSLHASWICRQAASQAQGDTFIACGYAESQNLMRAREESLEAAKREFKSFCNESVNCRNYAYTITPLRTDCYKDGSRHKCFRGIEYTILPQKKIHTFVDRPYIKRQIEDKEDELNKLKDALKDINKIDSLNKNIEKFKALDKAEIDIIELKHAYNDYQTRRNFGLFIGLHSLPLKDTDAKNANNVLGIGIGGEYQHHIWRNIFGKASLSFVGSGGEDKVKDRGTANSKSEIKYHSHSGIDANIGLPIVFKQFTLLPSAGFLTLSYKSTQVEYNNFGVGTKKIEEKHSYSTVYTGLGVRIGRQAYVGLEPRYYFNSNKVGGTVSVGIMIDF